jgi:hypothetical protein
MITTAAAEGAADREEMARHGRHDRPHTRRRHDPGTRTGDSSYSIPVGAENYVQAAITARNM